MKNFVQIIFVSALLFFSYSTISPIVSADPGGGLSKAEAVTTFFFDFNDGEIPDEILIIDANEGENNNGNPATGEVTWIINNTAGLDGTPCLYNRTHPGPADDWIVTPLVKLTDGYALSFFASCNASFPDSLEVFVSKTGREVEDFSIVISEGFRVAGSMTRYYFVITDHEDVSAGEDVYIGIRNYTHGSRIYLDDLGYGEPEAGDLLRAYTVSEDEIALLYDGPVGGASLSAENFVLQGTAEITFQNAEVYEDNDRLLFLSGASSPIEADLTVDSIINTEKGEYFKMYAGISPVAYGNVNNPDGFLPNDYPATFRVIAMAKNASNRVWLADGVGPRHGINAYGSDFHSAVEVGDEVLVFGIISPYLFQTEILAHFGMTLSTGNDLYKAHEIIGEEINVELGPDTDPAESLEGLLVTVYGARVASFDAPYFIATDDDEDHFFRIGDGFGLFQGTMDETLLNVGDYYNITGFVVNRDGAYRIVPRDAADISIVTSINDPEKEVSVNIYPNPVTNVLFVEAPGCVSIRVYDRIGSLVSETINPGDHARISMSQLNPGIYIIAVETSEGNIVNKKVIRY